MNDRMRERIVAAAVACASEGGVSRLSMETVAARAGVSRASVYRVFPGGRDELLAAAASAEVERFWGTLAAAVGHLDSLHEVLVEGLMLGAELLASTPVMANLLAPDLDVIVDALLPTRDEVVAGLIDYFRFRLTREPGVVEGVDPAAGAEYLTRMLLSFLGSAGGVDLRDRDAVAGLVEVEFLGGLIAPA